MEIWLDASEIDSSRIPEGVSRVWSGSAPDVAEVAIELALAVDVGLRKLVAEPQAAAKEGLEDPVTSLEQVPEGIACCIRCSRAQLCHRDRRPSMSMNHQRRVRRSSDLLVQQADQRRLVGSSIED